VPNQHGIVDNQSKHRHNGTAKTATNILKVLIFVNTLAKAGVKKAGNRLHQYNHH